MTEFKSDGFISVAYRPVTAALLSGFVGRYLHVGIPRRIGAERNLLLKRLACLNRTRNLFAARHVLHQPLVCLVLVIAVVHVGVALCFGYSWW